ncbi:MULTISPECIES: hypothetical protein [unclassified Coleofasciculus]|nr:MULTISPECIES: hypothetical protein [unclassified Coleofasciculus]
MKKLAVYPGCIVVWVVINNSIINVNVKADVSTRFAIALPGAAI